MEKNKALFNQLEKLQTEQRNPRSMKLDSLPVRGILTLMNSEDAGVPAAVFREIKSIGKAVNLIVRSLCSGGRLIYVGAGTSGRLGILDASECPPTFGTNPQTVQGIIAGGKRSVFMSKEGVEDSEVGGKNDIQKAGIRSKDVVCGIAASTRTPYVVGALKEARKRGARVVLLTTNPKSILRQQIFKELKKLIHVAICVDVGPEVLMGSTRMKSGTAQKLVLNMLTTASMIRMGKVYENMMIDLTMTSRKLEERAKRVLMAATGVDYNTANHVLHKARGHVKTAIVMILAKVSATESRIRLKKSNGFVRKAIKHIDRQSQKREIR